VYVCRRRVYVSLGVILGNQKYNSGIADFATPTSYIILLLFYFRRVTRHIIYPLAPFAASLHYTADFRCTLHYRRLACGAPSHVRTHTHVFGRLLIILEHAPPPPTTTTTIATATATTATAGSLIHETGRRFVDCHPRRVCVRFYRPSAALTRVSPNSARAHTIIIIIPIKHYMRLYCVCLRAPATRVSIHLITAANVI